MTSTRDNSLPSLPHTPAYLVGVTGRRDVRPEEVDPLKDRIRLLFRLLKPATAKGAGQFSDAALESWRADLDGFVSQLPDTSGLPDGADKKQPYRTALSQWPQLQNTPSVVLTSLAPGADTLVADVALDAGYSVIAALPLPPKHYVESPAFVWNGASESDNEMRQEKFRELLQTIGPGNHFVVRLADDMQLTEDELEQRYQRPVQDPACQSELDQRFRAVGEYMAAYSHLLIAVWDPRHEAGTEADTAAIVAARRRGLQPGLLPSTNPLGMPHGGPTIQLDAGRLNNEQPPIAAFSPVRFLQAHSIEHKSDVDDDDAAWQQQGLTLMTRIAANLDQFNKGDPVSPGKVHQELCNRLTYRAADGSLECFAGELRAHNRPLFTPLRRLAALRRRASDTNRRIGAATASTIKWLFWLTILAALALHFFAHWHPRNEAHNHKISSAEKPEEAATGGGGHSTDDEPAHDSAERDQWPRLVWWASWLTQVRIGIFAVVAALCALFWYWWRRSYHWGEQEHDYRAIAEGARVQFYWHLAGLGESVSANYMDRQRNELDWIRGAIRAVAFPYEEARFRFAALPAAQQIGALRCVLHGWIEDQRSYFKSTARRHEKRLHAWHARGNVLALAGLALVVLLVVDVYVDDHFKWAGDWGALLIWVSVLVAVLWPLAVWTWQWTHEDDKSKKRKATWGKWFAATRSELPDLYVPTTNAHRFPHNHGRTRWELGKNFLAHLPAAFALACVISGIVVISAERANNLPSAHNLMIVAAGCLLIGGAMAVAWAEKNLYSELAYQYHTMLSLFQNAHDRISRQIDRLVSLDVASNQAEYAKQLRDIQSAIRELGLEALDENAEWLILHRARPLEPVMAG